MISMDRLVLSMQALVIQNIGSAGSGGGDARSGTGTGSVNAGVAPQGAPPAQLEVASTEIPIRLPAVPLADIAATPPPGQSASQTLSGLRPPVAALMAADAPSGMAPDLAANPSNPATPAYLAAGLGQAFPVASPAALLPRGDQSGNGSGAAPDADSAASLEDRTLASAGFNGSVAPGDRPVTGGGDRTDLFDGARPAGIAMPDRQADAGKSAPGTSGSTGSPDSASLDLASLNSASLEPARSGDRADATTSASGTAALDTLAAADAQRLSEDVAQTVTQASATVERGGIIASFILNAAMIPGWPAHSLQGAAERAEVMAGRLPPDPEISEEEALVYLANLGADPELIEKVRKMLRKPPPGKKILLFLATMLTALTVVMDTLKAELAAIAEERKEREESRANPRGGSGRRKRIYLE